MSSDDFQDDLTVARTNRAFGDAINGIYRETGNLAGYQVILLDIDGLHRINSAYGYSAGDDVLMFVANRIHDALPTGAALFRVSVDEFAVFLPPNNTPLRDATQAFRDAVKHAGAPHVGTVTVSIGAAEATEADNPVELVRRSGAALYVARQKMPDQIVNATDVNHEFGVAEQEELVVRTALRLGEYVRHYLKIVNIRTGQPIGVEMLARWQQADMTVRAPTAFLPIVQRSGLSAEFDVHMVIGACHDWVGALRDSFPPLKAGKPVMTLHLDGEMIRQEGFAELLLHLVVRCGVSPDELVLEVTERAFEVPKIVTEFAVLRDAGMRISLQDFGLGSVMLGQLNALPIDWIKIDLGLVRGLDATDPDVSLITDMTRLATLLGVGISVEGIETDTLRRRLVDLGIRVGQGYLCGPPDTLARVLAELNLAQPVIRDL